MEQLRKEFEAAVCRAFDAPASELARLCERGPDGDYVSAAVQETWRGFQVGALIRAAHEDESDRQLILLALANLALLRPGFDHALRRVAQRMEKPAEGLYDLFKAANTDVKPVTLSEEISLHREIHGDPWAYPPAGKDRGIQKELAEQGEHSRYLGAGLYACFDDAAQIWLMAPRDGMTHKVAIDAGPWAALVRYQADMQSMLAADAPKQPEGDQ